ncbi:hypothetical protein QZH41_011605 [Actinostola sp. cb2023]|nr:hypothetical protein QZH41_011605 [Actinostola sp. cb2023]
MSTENKVVSEEKAEDTKHHSKGFSPTKHDMSSPSRSPEHREHKRLPFLIPSPIPTRRTRTTSHIEGEYVLKEGDRVQFRTCPLPPKMTEQQAVEVTITEFHGQHEKWWSGN